MHDIAKPDIMFAPIRFFYFVGASDFIMRH